MIGRLRSSTSVTLARGQGRSAIDVNDRGRAQPPGLAAHAADTIGRVRRTARPHTYADGHSPVRVSEPGYSCR